MSKLHIKKGDQVQVIAGDSKGQTGKVLKVEVSKQRAIVEGVNLCKKATKPNAQNPQGGIVEKEAPIHISNLLIRPKSHDHEIQQSMYRQNPSKLVSGYLWFSYPSDW